MVKAKLRILLLPFSILYGLGLKIRMALYQTGILKRIQFDIPVVAIGNLSTGGTGKTPLTEFLLSLGVGDELATLSRGYGRKTKGYREATTTSTAETIGDEPLQIKTKFPRATVCVSENRVLAIPEMLATNPNIKAIILDDAYQHLQVKAGKNILLTSYHNPYFDDVLLPAGNLRESRYQSRRADTIIVTKCPDHLTVDMKKEIIGKLQTSENQKVYFSSITYTSPVLCWDKNIEKALNGLDEALLVTGIADTEPLLKYIFSTLQKVEHKKYNDHYKYGDKEVIDIIKAYKKIANKKSILLTTEKDAMRLKPFFNLFREAAIELYYLPMSMKIQEHESEFRAEMKTYMGIA